MEIVCMKQVDLGALRRFCEETEKMALKFRIGFRFFKYFGNCYGNHL